MTPHNELLEQMKKRCEAATPGPWRTLFPDASKCNGWIVSSEKPTTYEEYDGDLIVENLDYTSDEDAAFICHARTDIPKLIAALEWTLGQIETYQDLYEYPFKSKKHEEVIYKILSGEA